ncbi:hypothetical protein IQ22_02338 [Pseudomonas duriflava]|uniref:Uncharacterized protein n=1 Tax=Pseudomonas duriflava TaxID=459528 RepID=A0A562QAI2_9PSED|nr:hypothetical protein [Pseudomonas duriflava]TWI53733.1 hypothetical protein IQ22_02338 [Pseudomonas duriflava]
MQQNVLAQLWDKLYWVMLWAVSYMPVTLAILGVMLIVGIKHKDSNGGRILLLLFGLVVILLAITVETLSRPLPGQG